MGLMTRIDRRAGTSLRRAVAALPGGRRAARLAAGALSPAFRVTVAVMIVRTPSRRAGLEALAASVGAATVARLLRDRLARRRPGPRAEGAFPSRHAAAATAIACAGRATISRSASRSPPRPRWGSPPGSPRPTTTRPTSPRARRWGWRPTAPWNGSSATG